MAPGVGRRLLLRVEDIDVQSTRDRGAESGKLRDQLGGHAFAINRRKMALARDIGAGPMNINCIANKLLARIFQYRQIF